MKKLLLVALVLAGCGSSTPAPKTPVIPRATARAAVDAAKDAWVTVAQICVDVGTASQDVRIGDSCDQYLQPAHDLIVLAAEAVDTQWSPAAGCALMQGAAQIANAAKLLPLKPTDAALVEDAQAVAAAVSSIAACGGGK